MVVNLAAFGRAARRPPVPLGVVTRPRSPARPASRSASCPGMAGWRDVTPRTIFTLPRLHRRPGDAVDDASMAKGMRHPCIGWPAIHVAAGLIALADVSGL